MLSKTLFVSAALAMSVAEPVRAQTAPVQTTAAPVYLVIDLTVTDQPHFDGDL